MGPSEWVVTGIECVLFLIFLRISQHKTQQCNFRPAQLGQLAGPQHVHHVLNWVCLISPYHNATLSDGSHRTVHTSMVDSCCILGIHIVLTMTSLGFLLKEKETQCFSTLVSKFSFYVSMKEATSNHKMPCDNFWPRKKTITPHLAPTEPLFYWNTQPLTWRKRTSVKQAMVLQECHHSCNWWHCWTVPLLPCALLPFQQNTATFHNLLTIKQPNLVAVWGQSQLHFHLSLYRFSTWKCSTKKMGAFQCSFPPPLKVSKAVFFRQYKRLLAPKNNLLHQALRKN